MSNLLQLGSVLQRRSLGDADFSNPGCLQLRSQTPLLLVPGTPGGQEAAIEC